MTEPVSYTASPLYLCENSLQSPKRLRSGRERARASSAKAKRRKRERSVQVVEVDEFSDLVHVCEIPTPSPALKT